MSDRNDAEAPADPAIGAEVARAIRPYRAVVPAGAVAELKARLAGLEDHPVAASILAQLEAGAPPEKKDG